MKSIWILAHMTFREAIRRRIVLTGLVLGVCFLLVFSVGFYITLVNVRAIGESDGFLKSNQVLNRPIDREGINTLLLTGLYAVTFLSVAMGALLGADTLSGEISSGTIQTIVTKPIRRSYVVLGKWLGFAALLGLYLLLMGGGTLASVFIQSGYYLPDHLFAGLGLIYLETLLVMTISLMFSSVFSTLATGGTVFGLYGLAFIGGWIEQIGALQQNDTAVKVGIVTSMIIPSELLWRRAAFEMQTPLSGVFGLAMSPFGTTSVPSSLMIVYAGLYLVVALACAVLLFQKRDL